MKCYKCGLPIASKNELVVGYLWALPLNGRVVSYHQKCFDVIHHQGFGQGIVPTASISLAKLGSQKWWNYRQLALTIIFLSFVSFFVIKQYGVNLWEMDGALIFVCLIFLYFPIMNLITIHKIEKLPFTVSGK